MATDTVPFVTDIIYVLISLAIAAGLFIIAKRIIRTKLGVLKGYNRILILVTIGIVFGESIYLIRAGGFGEIALDAITSAGVVFIVIAIGLQSQLKNVWAGIFLSMDPRINVGDIIEIQGTRGIITEMWITETIIETEEGETVIIPNNKFVEDVVKKRKGVDQKTMFDILQSEGKI